MGTLIVILGIIGLWELMIIFLIPISLIFFGKISRNRMVHRTTKQMLKTKWETNQVNWLKKLQYLLRRLKSF